MSLLENRIIMRRLLWRLCIKCFWSNLCTWPYKENKDFPQGKSDPVGSGLSAGKSFPVVSLQCYDAVGCVVGRASGLLKRVVGCWRGYLSGARSRFEIWPSWCHCHSLSLASVKSRLFWCWLTRVIPNKVQRAVKQMCVNQTLWVWVNALCIIKMQQQLAHAFH